MSATPTISFEFFPPKTDEGRAKLATARKQLARFKPGFFSVTFGAGGTTREGTLRTVLDIRAEGHAAAPHLSCIGSTRDNIRAILDEYRAHGIRHVVALRGDIPSGMGGVGEFRYANELVSFIREHYGDTVKVGAGNVVDAFSRWCVPVFVMISGALLLAPGKTEGAGTFYRKRAARVLVPLLFWSAFYLLWVFIKGSLKGNPPGAAALLHRIAIGEPYYHLWFLYMLVPLYLVTPLLCQIVARTTRKQLTWLVALAFVLAALNAIDARLSPRSGTFFPAWFLSYVPYFLLGHQIGRAHV